MQLPNQAVTLSPEQIDELNQKLSKMRHDINGFVTVIQLSAELIREAPTTINERYKTLADQPTRITEAIRQFSRDFEAAMGIVRH